MRRLIQGLGSPRAYIRKCYFATLVSILSNGVGSYGPLTLTYFKSIIDKQLSKFESKGVSVSCTFSVSPSNVIYTESSLQEEGDVLTGRILAYGVALRSKVFVNASVQLQQEILSDMLTKCKDRSYLPLLVYTFLVDFLHTVSFPSYHIGIESRIVTIFLLDR